MAAICCALFVLFLLLSSLPNTLARYVTVSLRDHLTTASINKRSDTGPLSSKIIDITSTCGDALSFTCSENQKCYTGIDGYIGCCSVSKCLPRTCIDYTPSFNPNCDYSTGGCWYCFDSKFPYCATITDVVASQYIVFCGATPTHSTLVYTSLIPVSSSGASPGSITSSQPQRTTSGQSVSTSSTTPLAASASTTDASISDISSGLAPSSSTITPLVIIQQPSSTTENSVSAASIPSDARKSPSPPLSSPGIISGIAIGSAAGALLILLLLYLLRKRINRRREAATSSATTTSKLNHAYEHGDGPSAQSTLVGAETSAANSPPRSPAELGTSTTEQRRTSYRVLNPDTHVPEYPVSVVPGRAEAPTDRPVQHPSNLHLELMSPTVSAITSPVSSSASTFRPSPLLPSPTTPRTPKRYTSGLATPSTPKGRYTAYSPSVYGEDGMPPSSLPRGVTGLGIEKVERQGQGQPPSGLQSYSSLPYVYEGDRTKQGETEAHDQTPNGLQTSSSLPSVYAGDGMPASSLTRGREAPSGLQRYSSMAELEGDSPSQRGRGGDEPWRYLSAENALAGGWKNENENV